MRDTISVKTSYPKQISAGKLSAKWSADGNRVLRYYFDITHNGLALHKDVTAPELGILENKVTALLLSWDKKWEAELGKRNSMAGKDLAEETMIAAEAKRDTLRNVLEATLDVNDEVDWDDLKNTEKFKKVYFSTPRPKEPARPIPPTMPEITFFQKLFGKSAQIISRYEQSMEAHDQRVAQEGRQHLDVLATWEEQKATWDDKQESLKRQFLTKQVETNKNVDDLRQRWEAGEVEAIVEHANLVLENSEYPGLLTKNFDIAYQEESGTILVEYELLDPEKLPLIKTVRFVAKTGELKETHISLKEAKSLFDDLAYQICLRTIHELLEADTRNFLKKVVFNGVTDTVDKRTGQNVRSTIMSILVDRDEFLNLDLARVDPKSCFKSLKGVSASSLAALAPIPPIMEINREDRRFIDARDVDLSAVSGTNLAAMNWEEFEHLVRQVFESEFSARGGEVKVTQSSSDGGVDAIAFDPDPISGGKIVIQAKRYTKTVGVSAVRDLYGTVLNEGASKGILVTTADFGPDAHRFASGKPITLMSGSNLLHLLGKHGTRATIDIAAARLEMGLSSK